MNYPPYYFSKKYSDGKIKAVEFYASVNVNMSMLLWVVYYGIQLLVVGLAFRSWPVLGIYAMLVPLMGYYVLNYYPLMKKIFGRWRLLRMVRHERNAVEKLVHERAVIIELLDEAKKGYLSSINIKIL
jgi:glycerol-3-phosphate O-acyltransferase/dihydroxyacetone phosphate acyltransferase